MLLRRRAVPVRTGIPILLVLMLSCLLEACHDNAATRAPLVIIGAGPAGLATAIAAGNAIVLEAADRPGGRGLRAGGEMFFVNTPEQRLSYVEDSVSRAAGDWETLTGAPPTQATLNFLRASSRVRDRLEALGARFMLGEPDPITGARRVHHLQGGGPALIRALVSALPDSVELRLSSPALGLVLEDHQLVGVRTRQGVIETAHAVIATGGFISREDLVSQHANLEPGTWEATDAGGAQGTALDWAAEYDLGTRDLSAIGWYVNRMGPAGALKRMFRPDDLSNVRWIWVNQQGRRFVDETRVFSLALRGAVLEEGHVWAVTTREAMLEPEDSLGGWVRDWLTGQSSMLTCAADWPALAELLEIDAGGLSHTIAGVIAARAAGQPIFPWRAPRTLPPLEAGTPCAFQITWLAAKNFGGLAVGPTGQVLATDGLPIHGLYAVGEAAGMGVPGMGGQWGFDGSLSAVVWSGLRTGAALAAQIP